MRASAKGSEPIDIQKDMETNNTIISLPVEILGLVFSYLEVADRRNLREVCRATADVGYDHLVPPQFNFFQWREGRDVDRLFSISTHARLRDSVKSVTYNLAELEEYVSRYTAYLRYYVVEPEMRDEILRRGWAEYTQAEKQRRRCSVLSLTKNEVLQRTFAELPRLETLRIVWNECPYLDSVLVDVFTKLSCRKLDKEQVTQNLETALSAAALVPQLSRLEIDHWTGPMAADLFCRSPPSSFGSLTVLKVALDSKSSLPDINSIDPLLPSLLSRCSHSLRHLVFVLDEQDLVGPSAYDLRQIIRHRDYNDKPDTGREDDSSTDKVDQDRWQMIHFPNLIELHLDSFRCSTYELTSFLSLHPKLCRLRLGGRGLQKSPKSKFGGLHLVDGRFKQLFTSMRETLHNLEKLHLEGHFLGPGDNNIAYSFYAVADLEWAPIPSSQRLFVPKGFRTGTAFEEFVTRGGPFPDSDIQAE
jgi:hypothetical protein